MVKRVAIYARYSSDLQSERSNEDQIALCKAAAKRSGFVVVATYEDKELSGSSTFERLGWQRLMRDAEARKFDLVLAEDVDRLVRDEADYHLARKRLTYWGVRIFTAHGGEVTAIEGSLRAMMSAQFLDNLAHKVRRGLGGVLRDGRHPGGRAYGYRAVDGKPGELAIVDSEAEVVCKIFASYVAGRTPRDIASELNRKGVKPPRGDRWAGSTINGNAKRKNGILQNEIYRGTILWNRVKMLRDPDTGRRVSRVNPQSEWQSVDAPHLRIVDEKTFRAAQERKRSVGFMSPRESRKPKRMLSGLLRCESCGAGMSSVGADRKGIRIACTGMREGGTCDNRRRYYLTDIENAVLEGLSKLLKDPRAVAHYIHCYNDERKQLARRASGSRGKLQTELAGAEREIDRAVKAIVNGTLLEEEGGKLLPPLRARRDELKAMLAAAVEPNVISLHPKLVERYLRDIDKLAETINRRIAGGGNEQLVAAFRDLVNEVIVQPSPAGKPVGITVRGKLSRMTEHAVFPNFRIRGGSLVAEEGFEPPTHGL
jgi:site-specific DNA recombinase